MRVLPAAEDSGVQFLRTDVAQSRGLVRAHWRNVIHTDPRLVLGNEYGTTVAAVGYLLAALKGCGIDNATVELDGPQVPPLDGSTATFVRMITYTGRTQQNAPQRVIRIEKPVSVNHGFGFAALVPADSPRFTLTTKEPLFNGSFHHLTFDLYRNGFGRELAWARAPEHVAGGTCAGEEDSQAGSKPTALIARSPRLRGVDERLRHGIVASIGDLYLAGVRILGHYHSFRACHWTNHRLLWQIFSDTECWSCVRLDDLPGYLPGRSLQRQGNGAGW